MKHLILGSGNLGLAIANQALSQEHEYKILSKSEGWEWPQNKKDLVEELDNDYDFVWCCVGAGSIDEGNKFWGYQLLVHVELPRFVIDNAPSTSKCIFFSSDYVRDGEIPFGKYGLSKQFMEASLFHSERDNFKIARVCNLITQNEGVTSKIHKAINSGHITVYENEIRPTNCDKLASTLFDVYLGNEDQSTILKFGGEVTTPIKVAAKYINENKAKGTMKMFGYDSTRPRKAQEVDYLIE